MYNITYACLFYECFIHGQENIYHPFVRVLPVDADQPKLQSGIPVFLFLWLGVGI